MMAYNPTQGIPPDILKNIQASMAAGQQWIGVDPATGIEYDATPGGNIMAGAPGSFANGGAAYTFDQSGAYQGPGSIAKPSNDLASWGLKAALGIGGAAMGMGALTGAMGIGGGTAAAGGAMDLGSFDPTSFGVVDNTATFGNVDNAFGTGGIGDFGSGGNDLSLAASDQAFNQALSDAGITGLSPQTVSSLSKLLGGGGGAGGLGGGNLGAMGNILGAVGALMSGNAAKQSAKTASDMANEIIQRSDPFYQYRAGYGKELADLETSKDVTGIPGYQAGLESVERAGAAQGFTGSGNMMKALQDYGGNFFNQREGFLARLAGADVQPGAGLATAAGLVSQGQASGQFGNQQYLNAIGQLLSGMGGAQGIGSLLSQGSQLFSGGTGNPDTGGGGGIGTPMPSFGGLPADTTNPAMSTANFA